MKLLSINIGQVQTLQWQQKEVKTAIFKQTVLGIQEVSFLGLKGDNQADKKHHGGHEKALYSYDNDYYDYWKEIFDRNDWNYGLFGENLTTEGLTDEVVCIGNIYQIGDVVLQAIQPRIPCFKLNLRFGQTDILAQFYERAYYGIYYRVLQEGMFQAGDTIKLLEKSNSMLTIKDLSVCYATKGENQALLNQILDTGLVLDELKKTYLRFRK